MADTTTYYPPVGFSFQVNITGIDGMNEGNFQEVTGLNVKLDVEEIKEGGENRFTPRLPSPPKYGTLVLRRGMVMESSLIIWANQCITQFQITPKTVVVMLLDENAAPISIWQFNNAYPVKLDYTGLKAKEGEIVIETLELAYDYFEKTL